MRVDNQKYHEVLDLMANFHPQRAETAPKSTHYLPFTESPRFWGRENILTLIDDALSADSSNRSLRSFALHGMGGVGKTQIALKYANASREKFDCVFWISAENLVTIGQSFREIAKGLGLIKPDTETDDNAVMLEVKQWLSTTSELCYSAICYLQSELIILWLRASLASHIRQCRRFKRLKIRLACSLYRVCTYNQSRFICSFQSCFAWIPSHTFRYGHWVSSIA